MCVIALAYKTAALGPLLIAANRDEYYARPSAALDFWRPDHPEVLGGRDLQAGGGWLAMDQRGRFAAVTHIRQGYAKPGARSRGELVQRFVSGDESALDFAAWLKAEHSQFAPFNLIFGEVKDLLHFSSRSGMLNRVPPGIHVLSNGDMNSRWFKCEQLRQKLALQKRVPTDQEIISWLSDQTPSPVEELPNTGVGLAMEKMLSPVFINGRDYGTRASSVLTLSARGELMFTEVSWGLGGRESGRRRQMMRIGSTRKP